ncbi:MAG: acetyl-CoA decarbonylase/synthase complex subunit gamma [Thermodesulfobacteriota bacterium]|nr:acetyl-CoA decarbonylase/synthase complex subunit gamma [Thermodesulfobacteriota bacterium]
MALKASDIQKKLPDGGKKNCKECGFPTCFAFAMKLASGAISVHKCQYIPEEIKTELEEALAPPIKLVTIGVGENALSIGEEEVIYRHEKTFYRPPGIAILITDKEDEGTFSGKINKIKAMQFDRVGQRLKANLFAVKYTGNAEKYLGIVKKVAEEGFPVVLICEDVNLLFKARDLIADKNPLLYPITKDNLDVALPKIKAKPTPIGIKANGIEEIVPTTKRLKEEGILDVVLDPSPKSLREMVRDYTLMRRAALKKTFRPLGYPIISFPCMLTENNTEEVLLASAGVVKYAGIIVLSDFDKATLYPLLVLRQNIYTDPRVPLAVEQKIYEIGEITAESPVLLTTNFALTYFAVASEIENTKIPSYLCVKDTEGLCVLAAWSTGKFIGETIAPFVKKSEIGEKVKNKRIIIPGFAARIKGELEDELQGWEIIVGPREASDLATFLPQIVEKWKSQSK